MDSVPRVIGVMMLLSPCQVVYIGYQTQLFSPNIVVVGPNSILLERAVAWCILQQSSVSVLYRQDSHINLNVKRLTKDLEHFRALETFFGPTHWFILIYHPIFFIACLHIPKANKR